LDYEALRWDNLREPLAESTVTEAERALGIRFPDDYRRCLIQFHGASPAVSDFVVVTQDGRRFNSCVGVLLTADPRDAENILAMHSGMGPYKDGPVIPIIDDGGGDFVCLDYRGKGAREAPRIVYFEHELGELHGLAATFADFCSSLFEPSET
jgi:cell wall assembly regulator SMI1